MKKFVLPFIIFLLSNVMCYSQWTRVTNIPATDITGLDLINGTLYAGCDSVLFRTTDSGITWRVTTPLSKSYENIQTVTSFAGKLFAGTYGNGV